MKVKESFFRNEYGELVLAQPPNLPIYVWLIATIVARAATNPEVISILELIAFGAIFTWAWLEIFQGANYFRRLLGVIVLFAAVYFAQ